MSAPADEPAPDEKKTKKAKKASKKPKKKADAAEKNDPAQP
jgi:hypothetical protein